MNLKKLRKISPLILAKILELEIKKSRLSDLNQPPARYECAALPDELSRRVFYYIRFANFMQAFCKNKFACQIFAGKRKFGIKLRANQKCDCIFISTLYFISSMFATII